MVLLPAIPVKVKPPLPPQSVILAVVCTKLLGALGVVNVNIPVTEQAGLPWLRTNTVAPLNVPKLVNMPVRLVEPPTIPYSNGGVPPLPVIVIAPFVCPQLVILLTDTAPNIGVPGAVMLNNVPDTEQFGDAETLALGVMFVVAPENVNTPLVCQVEPLILYCKAPLPPVNVTAPSAAAQLEMCFMLVVTFVGALGVVIV